MISLGLPYRLQWFNAGGVVPPGDMHPFGARQGLPSACSVASRIKRLITCFIAKFSYCRARMPYRMMSGTDPRFYLKYYAIATDKALKNFCVHWRVSYATLVAQQFRRRY